MAQLWCSGGCCLFVEIFYIVKGLLTHVYTNLLPRTAIHSAISMLTLFSLLRFNVQNILFTLDDFHFQVSCLP